LYSQKTHSRTKLRTDSEEVSIISLILDYFIAFLVCILFLEKKTVPIINYYRNSVSQYQPQILMLFSA